MNLHNPSVAPYKSRTEVFSEIIAMAERKWSPTLRVERRCEKEDTGMNTRKDRQEPASDPTATRREPPTNMKA
eukprot:scaffold5083_cov76-Skeletonema_dohrnii-CCMP3373.AAC.2